jgi:ferrous iron transport protein A
MSIKPLAALRPGETGVIDHLETPEEASRKLMELGIGPGEEIRFLRQAPLGGPLMIELMGYRLCVRAQDAAKIFVR